MRWPWSRREPVRVNGHVVAPGLYSGSGHREVKAGDLLVAIPLDGSPPLVLSPRRESRRCEEWYVGPGIDRGELEGNARRCFERTRIPQRVHGHPFGHLCTSSCRVVAGEEIE